MHKEGNGFLLSWGVSMGDVGEFAVGFIMRRSWLTQMATRVFTWGER